PLASDAGADSLAVAAAGRSVSESADPASPDSPESSTTSIPPGSSTQAPTSDAPIIADMDNTTVTVHDRIIDLCFLMRFPSSKTPEHATSPHDPYMRVYPHAFEQGNGAPTSYESRVSPRMFRTRSLTCQVRPPYE